MTRGIIFELLMRLRKYYEIDKIVINQSKFVLKILDSFIEGSVHHESVGGSVWGFAFECFS